MPELPEVTTTVTGMHKVLPGLHITDVWSDFFVDSKHRSPHTIKQKKYFAYFKERVVDQRIIRVYRRAKYIVIDLSNKTSIITHMKMTGHYLYGVYTQDNTSWKAVEPESLCNPFSRFVHLVFTLSNKKHLAFSDMRKFGNVYLVDTADVDTHFTHLGPEPLTLSYPDFSKALSSRKNGLIKSVLMDQSVIAGIGNIYSDEILWQAGVLPTRDITTLTKPEKKRIYTAMQALLQSGIDLGGDSQSDYRNLYGEKGGFQNTHKAYRRTKQRCLKKGCRGTIERKIIGGRSAHFCRIHQK